MAISNKVAKTAINAINQHGILLVFPIQNREEPPSLWRVLHPNTKMRWEWDAGGDGRVAELWHLREKLSRSGEVVYTKWYQNRATFFSRELFAASLAYLNARAALLGQSARTLLELLEESSPQSNKVLKASYNRLEKGKFELAAKELWARLLIVGFGEVDDGAFPSLALGATSVLFDDLWRESLELNEKTSLKQILNHLPNRGHFARGLNKTHDRLRKGTKTVGKKLVRYEDLKR
jgi:hypothetical protein